MFCIFIMAMTFCVTDGVAKKARTVHLSEKQTETICLVPGHTTILSFPSRPTKVLLGNPGAFSVEYIENDLGISALRFSSRSNLFVYFEGRRYGFNLRVVSDGADEIVLVRDADEKTIKVKVKNE